MTDILKTLDEWEADAKDRVEDSLRMKSVVEEVYGPKSYDLDLERFPNYMPFRVLTLTKALRIALDNIQNASQVWMKL